ncbi:hypothetical protein ABIA06_005354 [Bradyrhizobium yuanmingense]|uniref:hypothetical protein n=1 Tax=Bradyrhizobium yuanmingense TaxID=108015 RepID=UPI003512697C
MFYRKARRREVFVGPRISAGGGQAWIEQGELHASFEDSFAHVTREVDLEEYQAARCRFTQDVVDHAASGRATASSAIFAFNAASILRLVFVVIIRSVYQTEPPLPTKHVVPKSGAISGDGTSFFHASPIDEEHLSALKAGELSLRGALTSDQIVTVELTRDLYIKRFWQNDIRLWGERFLPARRIGLMPQGKLIWDSLVEARALLALTFQGASLGNHMPLGMLTTLVRKTRETARRILLSPDLLSLKSASIDFHVAPPKFSSLVLALQNPVFRKKVIQKRLASEDAPEQITSEI